ncbi:hypothetical protein EJ05DRAFT_512972 [Pseudovirgaria hyperparasitica]|uniref:Uncharacterized protein n=1 Tax=Pseudovirgaria hyperparasitica TaxID=470096 RepID=A0A6A6VYV5_9PEZI|nr:uncharacterized protein EJ05DRAFT_512972 [Pseudovirgaria hyperparasitica]KAF2755463.1 hypothetical protein EJ05DRAFT_512972 [Pseudovirgaria hyperparasitica]
MLSLPLITPHEDLNIWHTNPSHRPIQTLEHTDNPQAHAPPQHSRRAQANPRSMLSLLAADENLIEQRKQNVRRFGASWIRPPGIAKTYQASMDELAEREEQELLARREQAMLELANAAEAEAQRAEAEIAAEEANEVDRDLDEDVPEADEEPDLDDDIPEADSDSDDGEGEMTFNEESFIEGSMVQADVEQILEMEEGASMMHGGHDLDDDIPEAGSYQHTDTEAEDSSELAPMDEGSSRVIGNPNVNFNRSFRSQGESSLFGGSSFLGSSPVAGRGGAGNLFSRAQQQQARQQSRQA